MDSRSYVASKVKEIRDGKQNAGEAMKGKPTAQTKWGKFARRLAKLKTGESFLIDPARYGRKDDRLRFAREIRNGLNGHKCCMLIRRSVTVRGSFIEIKRVGDWL